MEGSSSATCYIVGMLVRRPSSPRLFPSFRALAPGLTLASLVVLLSCGGSDDSSGGADGPVARFHLAATGAPTFLDVPFPSDVYLSGGKIGELPGFDVLFPHSPEFLTHELSKLNGFSRVAMSLFYIDDPSAPPDEDTGEVGAAVIDPTSLPATEQDCVADSSSVFLLDLEATDPAKARVACRAQDHVEGGLSSARPLVGVGPARGIVLEEGHRYAAILTSRVRDKSGKHVAASPEFQTVTLDVYAKALDTAKTLLAGALAGDKSEIVAIAPFTTQATTHELFDLRSAIEDDPVPPLQWDSAALAPMGSARFAQKDTNQTLPPGFTASLDDWLGVVDPKNKLGDGSDDPDSLLPVRAHDAIAAVGTAVFDAENFLQDLGDYNTLDHATFKVEGDKIVRSPQKPTDKIWVTFAVPTSPMPPGGYPAVIIQHGLSGSRQYLFDLANVVCKKGWIAVAIDSVTFGARAPESRFHKDDHTDYEAAPGATYKGPDGIADPDSTGSRNGSFDFFGGLKNLGALRDQLRQAGLDTAQLARVLRSNPDLAPLKTGTDAPKIDPERIAYIGDSLGGIEGALAAAIEPNIKLWTLNVAGGGLLLELASHAPTISLQLNAAAGLNFGLNAPKLNESHPMITVVQTIVDPGDPLSFAGDLVMHPGSVKGVPLAPRNILQIEVIFDELVANEANEALARAGGYGLATPNVGSNAGILDLKNIEANPGRTPLADVAPGADGAIHDTPVQGVTAVVVQTSPSQHGYDMVRSRAKRSWAIPYADYSQPNPFTSIDSSKQFEVQTSFREIQATITQFIDDGFAGKVPRVSGFKPPVRDMDDDGNPDATDPDPSNPESK